MITSIAVAIINYNTREHLRACLETVLLENPDQVIVVDNASSDGSVEMIQAEYPWVVLHVNKANRGFGAAANQAIAKSSAKYVLLLNSDIRLQPWALKALATYLDENPQVAIVGPRLVGPDGKLQTSCYPFPNVWNTLFVNTSLGRILGYIPLLRNYYLPAWPHTQARVIPWVTGAALAIRCKVFQAVGGFDETFFMYYEEVDLCYRLEAAGWEVHFAPVTTMVHVGGASTMQNRVEMAVQLLASNWWFFQKHRSGIHLAAFFGLLKGILLIRWILDHVRLRMTADGCKRARLAACVAAWKAALRDRLREGPSRG